MSSYPTDADLGTNPQLPAALDYARRGWPVLPLHKVVPDGTCSCGKANCTDIAKHPVGSLVEHGLTNASTNLKTIANWWLRRPGANVGIATGPPSGLLVVDVDERHGGVATMRDLVETHGRLPATVVARTGNGWHYYFQCPPVPVQSGTGVLGAGVDVRCAGGYVVSPPSRHASGRSYRWVQGRSPDDVRIAPPAEWILDLCTTTERPPRADPEEPGLPIPEGSRNSYLARMAGGMCRLGATIEEISTALAAINTARCTPPLSDREVQRIAQSVGRYAPEDLAELAASYAVVTLDDVVPEVVGWIDPGRLALKKIVLGDGDPGLGKTTVLLDYGARITRGWPMPGGAQGDLDGPAGVVVLTAEDGLADTVVPRLAAAGADLTRVVALTGVPDRDGTLRPPTIGDLGALDYAIGKVAAKLVIIDPLMAFLPPGVNPYHDHEIRRALAPLAALAERTGVCIVCVRHLTKSGGANPLYRGGGSIGIIGAARSGLLTAVDPDDPTGTTRILAVTKANLSALAPSLKYRLGVNDAGVVRVEWLGTSPRSAADLLAAADPSARTARDDAIDFLRAALAKGAGAARDLRREAEDQDITEITLRRARTKLGVQTERTGFGPGSVVTWRLPAAGVSTIGDQGDQVWADSIGDHPDSIGDHLPGVSKYGEGDQVWDPDGRPTDRDPGDRATDDRDRPRPTDRDRATDRPTADGDRRPAGRPAAPCRSCQSVRFWRPDARSAWTCAHCHPPAPGVEEMEVTGEPSPGGIPPVRVVDLTYGHLFTRAADDDEEEVAF